MRTAKRNSDTPLVEIFAAAADDGLNLYEFGAAILADLQGGTRAQGIRRVFVGTSQMPRDFHTQPVPTVHWRRLPAPDGAGRAYWSDADEDRMAEEFIDADLAGGEIKFCLWTWEPELNLVFTEIKALSIPASDAKRLLDAGRGVTAGLAQPNEIAAWIRDECPTKNSRAAFDLFRDYFGERAGKRAEFMNIWLPLHGNPGRGQRGKLTQS